MPEMTADDLLSAREVCAFFGGSGSPLDRSTLYRGIRAGRFPKPIKVGPKMSRWYRSECVAARAAMGRKENP